MIAGRIKIFKGNLIEKGLCFNLHPSRHLNSPGSSHSDLLPHQQRTKKVKNPISIQVTSLNGNPFEAIEVYPHYLLK